MSEQGYCQIKLVEMRTFCQYPNASDIHQLDSTRNQSQCWIPLLLPKLHDSGRSLNISKYTCWDWWCSDIRANSTSFRSTSWRKASR